MKTNKFQQIEANQENLKKVSNLFLKVISEMGGKNGIRR